MYRIDELYRGGILSWPHRYRVRAVLRKLDEIRAGVASIADVGSGDGYVTSLIAAAFAEARVVGFDQDTSLLERARATYPDIEFFRWDLVSEACPVGELFDLVVCLETLEHVLDVEAALDHLLRISRNALVITVPIEHGLIGAAKFAAKVILRRPALTSEHRGTAWAYVFASLFSRDVGRFRVRPTGRYWASHQGWDFRSVAVTLAARKVAFETYRQGWNQFYVVRLHGHAAD